MFEPHRYGSRPGRSAHDAVEAIFKVVCHRTKYVLDADIAKCFDNIDHEVLLRLLGEHIHDNRFLELIRRLLQAGYLEDWRYGATLSGTPQGEVVSPVLSNVYLDQLDRMLKVPWDVIVSMCSRYKARGKPEARPNMLNDADFSIIGRYGAELRGYVNYYALAHSVGK